MLTESCIPQSSRSTQIVNSASPDGAALHAVPSAAGLEPKRRCLPSTRRPWLNRSACTTSSIESEWHLTRMDRGWSWGSQPGLFWTSVENGWTRPRDALRLTGRLGPRANSFSMWVQTRIRTTIHEKGSLWGLRSILGPGRGRFGGPKLSPQLWMTRGHQTHLSGGFAWLFYDVTQNISGYLKRVTS